MGPALLVICVTLIYPTLNGISLSFHEVDLRRGMSFVGFEHYIDQVEDSDFWQVVTNTFAFAIGSTIGTFLIGFSMALLLNVEGLRLRRFWRVLFLIPWTMSSVATGLGWKWMYDTLFGVFNDTLLRLGLVVEPVLWLASRELAMPSVIVANIWRGFPFFMILLLAGLQAVPRELYEAASIDGANFWRKLRHITIPHLRTLIFVGTSLEFMFHFRQFDLIFVMTRGGPGNTTEILPTLVNKQATQFFKLGEAATTSVFTLLILLVFIVVYMRVLRPDNSD